jgi:predicted MFS family arabinose efflux permease
VALGYVALTVVAIPSRAAARLAAEGRDREGLFFGLSGLANGLGNALGAFAASALLASHTLEGVRATIAFAGLAALAAALALPRPPK